MRSTTAARSGDVATRRTHFPLLSFGLAIALLASWLFFGAVLLNFPAAQHNACGSVWNSSSPAADGEDPSRIARTPLRARRRLAQSKPSEATEGPLTRSSRGGDARCGENGHWHERYHHVANETASAPTPATQGCAGVHGGEEGVLERAFAAAGVLEDCRQAVQPETARRGRYCGCDGCAQERAMLDPLNAFQLRHLEQDIARLQASPAGPYGRDRRRS